MQNDDRCSGMGHAAFGVPQGSILGSVNFELYVADLCQCFQYADDTTLYIYIVYLYTLWSNHTYDPQS